MHTLAVCMIVHIRIQWHALPTEGSRRGGGTRVQQRGIAVKYAGVWSNCWAVNAVASAEFVGCACRKLCRVYLAAGEAGFRAQG